MTTTKDSDPPMTSSATERAAPVPPVVPSEPVSWSVELERRRAAAAEMGGPERVARQHDNGRLTVRERIELLLDAGSFREIGGIAGKAEYDEAGDLSAFQPANFVFGQGRINGQRVAVGGDDFTVRGGSSDASIAEKQISFERMAGELKIPCVRLVEGSGGGGSVKALEDVGYTYIPENPGWDHVIDNMSRVPVIAAALGPVAGLGAARLVTSHFSVMVKENAQLFIAGPPLVLQGMNEEVTKEELGGWQVVCKSGAVDNAVDTEKEALQQVRQVLSILPPNVWTLPQRVVEADDPERRDPRLRTAIPPERRRGYDARSIITSVMDAGSVFEIGRLYGGSTVTCLARLDGYPVAVVAGDPYVYGAAMTGDSARKLTRFVDLADTFHIPVVNFVDQPGLLIGSQSERAGTIREGARALAAVYEATVPWACVIVRRVFGVGGAAHRNHVRHGFRVAWPSGDWGSLPIEGGLEAAYKRVLEASADPGAAKAQIEVLLNSIRSPFRTAEAFGVEDIIDPAETRPMLCDWVESAYAVLAATPISAAGRRCRP